MEPLPSGHEAKAKSAARFDEAQANRRNACLLEVARYMGDVENRLRKEDYHRFASALTDLHKASGNGAEAMAAAREAVLRIISGEPDLVAEFEGFLVNIRVIWGRDVAYAGFLGGDGRPQGWRPGGKSE